MKLEQLNEAAAAVATVVSVPLETRIRLGLVQADVVVKCVRSAAFTAQQAKIAGTLDPDMKEAILDQVWEELVCPT